MAPPRGQFGNRLDTAAGRAKEAAMAAAAQALVVAHSEAVHGRPESAAQALATAQAAVPANVPAAFQSAFQSSAQNIQSIMPPPSTPNASGPDWHGGRLPAPKDEFRGSTGGGTPPPPPPPPPTPPNPWMTTPTFVAPAGVRQADPDIVLDPEIDTTGDFIVERFFEELGGTELIDLSRYDLIDGISVVYNPIANLSRLRQRFNPNNIIALDILSQDEFARASINLIARGIYEPYFDDNGNLVVEIDIIKSEENIDVQISESGSVTRIEL